MSYRKIDQAMRRGQQWAEEQVKAGIAITPDLVEKAASEAFQHIGQQYLFITSAMEVMLKHNSPLKQSA